MSITSKVRTLLHRMAGKRSFNEAVISAGGSGNWDSHKSKTLEDVGNILFQNGVRFTHVDADDEKSVNVEFTMDDLAREEQESDRANPASRYVGKGPTLNVKLEPQPGELASFEASLRRDPIAVSPLFMEILMFYVLSRITHATPRNYSGAGRHSSNPSQWPPAQQECLRRMLEAGWLQVAFVHNNFGTNLSTTSEAFYVATNKALWVLSRAAETVGRCL